MSGRQQVQHLNNSVALLTLADVTAVIVNTNIDSTREEGVRLKQLKAGQRLTGLTDGEGPLIYGWALNATAAEIAEALVADPQFVEDVNDVDVANRKVFPVGIFEMSRSNASQELREVNFPWKEIPEGATLKWFVFNASGSSLTTGATAHLFASVVQEWLRD